jgi:hypothetical protein
MKNLKITKSKTMRNPHHGAACPDPEKWKI